MNVTVRFETFDPLFRRKQIVLLDKEYPTRAEAERQLGIMARRWNIPTDCRVVMYETPPTIEEELGIVDVDEER